MNLLQDPKLSDDGGNLSRVAAVPVQAAAAGRLSVAPGLVVVHLRTLALLASWCGATLVPVFAANSVLVGLTSVSALAGPTTTRGSSPRRQQTLAGREATAHRQYDLIV